MKGEAHGCGIAMVAEFVTAKSNCCWQIGALEAIRRATAPRGASAKPLRTSVKPLENAAGSGHFGAHQPMRVPVNRWVNKGWL